MKAPFSKYLDSLTGGLRTLIDLLSEDHDYVSALATDSKGLVVRISQHSKSVGNRTMTTERGLVLRVRQDGLYFEYATDGFDPQHPELTAETLRVAERAQRAAVEATGTAVYETGIIPDEPWELFVERETEYLPEDCEISGLVEKFSEISDRGMAMSEYMLDCNVAAQSTHVCKLFLTKNRYLRQSYVYSEGGVAAIVAKDGQNRLGYKSLSGLCGIELFDGIDEKLRGAVDQALELLDSDRIEPGEYDIITSPEVSGLIAHEAFGHGVEMDMFVKGRALGVEYIGKRVGSELVTMHEGALCAENVTSYAFDDEGFPAGDVTEIDRGILKTGICDALSALRLGTVPTGNGKRENFEHKVYTRMTNTVFDSGSDSLGDMIASVKRGYLLEGMDSGMEDPKHWGIQCIITLGREIIDGKLTGRVVAPVIMTGYVPDLLGSVRMASPDRQIFGSGGCGKGHKEWVKVSDGGPYLLTRARLG